MIIALVIAWKIPSCFFNTGIARKFPKFLQKLLMLTNLISAVFRKNFSAKLQFLNLKQYNLK